MHKRYFLWGTVQLAEYCGASERSLSLLTDVPQRPLGGGADEVDADAGQPHVGAVPHGEGHPDAGPRGGVVAVLVLAAAATGVLASLSTRVDGKVQGKLR